MKVGLEKKLHQELLPTARGTHNPLSTCWGSSTAPKAQQTFGFVHSGHMGTKGIFCIAEILYINIFCL